MKRSISQRGPLLTIPWFLLTMGAMGMFAELVIYLLLAKAGLKSNLTGYGVGGGFLGASVGGLVGFLWYSLYAKLFEYELRDFEFRQREGVLNRYQKVIGYSRIQSVDLDRSIGERLLGLATVRIQTSGARPDEGRVPWLPLAEAEALRDELLQRAERIRVPDPPATANSEADSISGRQLRIV